MSVTAIAWALKVRVGSPTLKSVLIAIANYADEDGLAWPSQARLALDTELSERAVRAALKALEDKGLIVREERPRRADNTRQSDIIRLVAAPMRNVVPVAHAERGAAPTGTSCRNHAEPRSGKPSIEPSLEPSGRARPRTKVNPDLPLTDERRAIGGKHGLNVPQTQREWLKFKAHHGAAGSLMANWDMAWDKWCIKAAEILGVEAPRAAPEELPPGFHWAHRESDQFEAWVASGHPASLTDKNGGWPFPSEFPPQVQMQAAE